MKLILESERIVMHPHGPADLSVLQKTFNHPFVRKYLWDDKQISLDQTREVIDLNAVTFRNQGWGLWKIIIKSQNEYAGFAGLWTFFDEPQPQLIFGLLPQSTGKGYATEAARCILRYAFKELSFPYVSASFDAENIKSEKVCQRLKMDKDGERVTNGKLIVFYRIVPAESFHG